MRCSLRAPPSSRCCCRASPMRRRWKRCCSATRLFEAPAGWCALTPPRARSLGAACCATCSVRQAKLIFFACTTCAGTAAGAGAFVCATARLYPVSGCTLPLLLRGMSSLLSSRRFPCAAWPPNSTSDAGAPCSAFAYRRQRPRCTGMPLASTLGCSSGGMCCVEERCCLCLCRGCCACRAKAACGSRSISRSAWRRGSISWGQNRMCGGRV